MIRKNFLKSSIFFAFFFLLLGGAWGQTTTYIWKGATSSDWDEASNWTVEGEEATDYPNCSRANEQR